MESGPGDPAVRGHGPGRLSGGARGGEAAAEGRRELTDSGSNPT